MGDQRDEMESDRVEWKERLGFGALHHGLSVHYHTDWPTEMPWFPGLCLLSAVFFLTKRGEGGGCGGQGTPDAPHLLIFVRSRSKSRNQHPRCSLEISCCASRGSG